MPTSLEHIQYGFDRDGRRTWQKRPLTSLQDQHYGYDTLSQVNAAARGSLNTNLTAISGTPVLAESWAYDPTGNWRGYEVAATGATPLDQHRVHDRGNRMTQIEGNPHNQILDRAGRMRQMAPDAEGDWDGKLELTWDAWSRITKVRNNGEVVGEYTYDGAHRRVTREVEEETLHSYYNDAWRPVEERRDSETTASMSYLWGSRHRDDLVRRDRAVGGTTLNETRYILMDYFSPAAITDEEGEVTERYAFSAFGVRTILNADYTVRGYSESAMEFGFQGQFLDGESGLMNYGYRYYSPYLGRWTYKDPIAEVSFASLNRLSGKKWNKHLGIAARSSLYSFVRNRPINKVDHLGLAEKGGCKIKVRCGYVLPTPLVHCEVIVNGYSYGIGGDGGMPKAQGLNGSPVNISPGGASVFRTGDIPPEYSNVAPQNTPTPLHADYPGTCECPCDWVEQCMRYHQTTTEPPAYNAWNGPNSNTYAHRLLNVCRCSVNIYDRLMPYVPDTLSEPWWIKTRVPVDAANWDHPAANDYEPYSSDEGFD